MGKPEVINNLKKYLNDIELSLNDRDNKYVPLSLSKYDDLYDLTQNIPNSTSSQYTSILESSQQLNRFSLVGDPGSGKSTSLNYLFYRLVENALDTLDQNDDETAVCGVISSIISSSIVYLSYSNRE